MSRFNTSTNHPIIPNSQQYMYEQQFISIHSEDRDITKFPNSSEFTIELPQDYQNVQGVVLSDWTFPSNYNVFSQIQNNTYLIIKITDPYNPGAFGIYNPYQTAIFEYLYSQINTEILIPIQEGFYNPEQMAKELTNRMNEVLTQNIAKYLSTTNPAFLEQFTGYTEFVVVYNSVSQRLWFGNSSSKFVLVNDSKTYVTLSVAEGASCAKRSQLPDYSNWGLPAYLGFTRITQTAIKAVSNSETRFYYGDVLSKDDNGYWIEPNPELVGSSVYFIVAPFKLNLMGFSHFYMEIAGMNALDETIPYAVSGLTRHTNETNGIVKSAFAKIPVPVVPLAQWFDYDSRVFKIYNPPAERIRKLSIRIRYHNGQLVDFGTFPYSFTLEFTIFNPQIQKKYKMYVPETIENN